MASRTMKKLENCLKSLKGTSPISSQVFNVCHLHSMKQNYQHSLNRILKADFLANQSYRYSSNIVKSPFKEIEIPSQLIPELIWETVDRFPESPAMKCGLTHQSYSYADVQKLSLRLANSFRKAGFRQGETVALVLPNCCDFPVVLLGALEAELNVSFVNHVYTPDEMCHQLKDSGSVCVVTGAALLPTVQAAIKKVEESTKSKPIRKVIVVDTSRSESIVSGVTRYSEMIADGIDQSRKITNRVHVNDLALLPYSSGTTGLSKGVCLSHRNIVANTYQIAGAEGSQLYSPDKEQDILLGLLPFYHIYGLVVILLNGLKSGCQIITLPKFEQESFIQTLENFKLTVMMMVPPLILFLGNSPKVTSKHFMHIRRIFSGAAPLGASDMEKVSAKLPSQSHCYISQAYGMTETSPVTTLTAGLPKNLATVGAPVSNTLAKIVSLETGKAVKPNQSGELCFKGPQVMLGYHNNPTATADMIDEDGWLKTGDIGYYDEDSHFYVQDRMKELIKVKGFQVPPAELEEVLRTHPMVSDVGVIGVPDPRAGETPVAYIVKEKGKNLTLEEVKKFLSEKVSRHKQVSEVIFIDSIPKSAAGKILRKDLRNLYKTNHK